MKLKRYPKVSFVICTLDCKDYLEICLKSIRSQDYPQEKVEIVIVDSYSTDGTLDIAKKYKSNIILTKIRGYMEGKGMPKSIGCEKAKGDIIFTLDSDNSLVEKNWISKMVYPLLEDKKVDYCISRMLVTKKDPLVNQYLSLVGTDPFAIYTSLDPKISMRSVNLEDKGKYKIHKNTKENFLLTGGYYLAFRKETLKNIGGYSRDVDVAYTLASRKEGATIAIPKNTHLHHLITKGFFDFFRKKIKWGKYYFNNPNLERKFNWSSGLFGKNGKIRFSYEVIKNLLFYPELIRIIKIYSRDTRKPWLIHPFLVWSTTLAYIIAFLKVKTS